MYSVVDTCSCKRARKTLADDLGSVRGIIEAELGLDGRRLRAEHATTGIGLMVQDWRNVARCSHDIVKYAVGSSGKLVRPTLLLLCARACGQVTPQHYRLAAAVELIHGASLAHDDVLDESMRRRYRPTLNARWGNELAILSGDILFANAFRISAEPSGNGAAEILARASCLTCLGETEQTFCEKGHPLSEEAYLKIVEMKTASVFSAACELGASHALRAGRRGGSVRERWHGHLAHDSSWARRPCHWKNDAALVESFARFGRSFGIAYQLADDLVDLVGIERRVGKTLGRDIAGGKMTLPLIRLLNAEPSSGRRRALMRAIRDTHSARLRRRVARMARESGVVADTMLLVRQYVEEAKRQLEGVPRSVWLDILLRTADNISGADKFHNLVEPCFFSKDFPTTETRRHRAAKSQPKDKTQSARA